MMKSTLSSRNPGARAFTFGSHLGISLLLLGLGATSAVSQGGPMITLDPASRYQTITGWEVVDYAFNQSPAFPNFINTVLDDVVQLGVNRIRLEIKSGVENAVDNWALYTTGQIDYPTWRCNRYVTVNDNGDPNSVNWSGFQFSEIDWTIDNIVLPLKTRVESRGEKLFINLCYVAFTSQIQCGGQYIHDNPQEYGEFVLATYLHLQSKYGWVPDAWTVILEPDNVSQWATGTVLGNAIVAAAARLLANGFTPRFVAPETTDMGNASRYFDEIAQVPGALQYLDEISYHRYSGVSSAALQAIVTRALANGKNTSMLEWWSSGNSYAILHEDLKQGLNSAWQWGAIAGQGSTDICNVDDSNPSSPQVTISAGAKFIRQYFKFVRAGAVRIAAASASGTVDPLAFINADGTYVTVVKAASAGAFSILGLPAGTYGIKYTTSTQYDVDLPDATVVGGQAVGANIPSTGVITIYGKAAAPPAPGTLQFSSLSYSVKENGGQATITVTRTGGSSGPISANYSTSDGTGVMGSDYTASSSTLTWADGDSSSKTFTVPILDDPFIEANETVNLTLSGTNLGTPVSAVLTIVDDDAALPAPLGVAAMAGDGRATVVWNPVGGATSYNLYMASAAGVTRGNYASLPGGMRHTNVTSPFVHTGLTNGTTYFFVITALNASGEGGESVEVSATPSAGGWPILDTDGDGYSDAAEIAAGSNPTNPLSTPVDADGDGMADAWEQANLGGISALPGDDPDGDGASNLLEYNAQTNPRNPDSDGDGYTDGAELAAGSNPLDPTSVTGGAGGARGGGACGVTGIEALLLLLLRRLYFRADSLK